MSKFNGYEYFVIFRIYKADSGKCPRDTYFAMSSETFHDLHDEFSEALNVIKLE